MKNFKFALLSLLVIATAGCYIKGANDPEIIAENQATLKGEPDVVGKLPDGRVIYRYRINMGTNNHAHWIYIVEKSDVVTNNRLVDESDGENTTTFSEVDVIVKKRK